MIQVLNGRIRYDNKNTDINCFIVIDNVEYPIYKYKSNEYMEIELQQNRGSVEGESFADGGAWSTYILKPKKKFYIKYFIKTKTDTEELQTQIYFKPSKEINSYTIKTLPDKYDSSFDTRYLINGCVKYVTIKEINAKINGSYAVSAEDHKLLLIGRRLF